MCIVGTFLDYFLGRFLLMEITVDLAFLRGVEAHRAGEVQDADRHYTAVLNVDPKHADANHNKGILAVDLGMLEQAVPFFKTALEVNPSIEQFWISYISTLLNLHQIDEAKITLNQAKVGGIVSDALDTLEKAVDQHQVGSKELSNNEPPPHQLQSVMDLYNHDRLHQTLAQTEQMLEQFPNSLALINIQGATYAQLEQFDSAIESFRKSVAISPNHVDALFNMSICLEAKGDIEGALDGYKKVIEINPRLIDVHGKMGSAFQAKGNLDSAIASYRQVLKINPAYAAVYCNIGVCLKEKGDIDGAINSYRQAINIKSDFAEAYSNMGIAMKAKGDLDGAINSYNMCAEINPQFANVHCNIGNILKLKGDLDGAINSYRRAIEIEPHFAQAFNNMGVALLDRCCIDQATNCFEQAIELNPEFADALVNMGRALNEKGDLDGAIKSFRQAIKINPALSVAYNNLGITQQENSDLGDAMESYAQAIQIDPDYADAHNNLGNVFNEKGDLDRALESYTQAIKITPVFADAHNNIGIVRYKKGDLDGALESLNKAVDIEPDDRCVWDNMFFVLRAAQTHGLYLHAKIPLLEKENLSNSVQTLASLLKYRLDFGGVCASASLNKTISLLSVDKKVTIENPDKNIPKIGLKPNLLKEIVALLHFGRSGTGLLHSLIDGHSQVSTLPSIYFGEFFDPATWEKITLGGWHDMPDRFIAMYPVFFDATESKPLLTSGNKLIYNIGQKEGMTHVGFGRDEALTLDKALFRSELLRLMTHYNQLDAMAFFQLIHIAYEKVLVNADDKRLIFYHIHSPADCTKLNFAGSAPTASWLMMVREPIQCCESWSRDFLENHDCQTIYGRIITMLFQIDDVSFCTQKSVGIRLEDLKTHPTETLLALCDWMGIGVQESLYEMTAQGKKWWGDPTSQDYSKQGMTPFGDVTIRRNVGAIFSDDDQFILRTLFYPFSVRFGYVEGDPEQFKNDLRLVRPMSDQIFDFERVALQKTSTDVQQFIQSGPYQYFRAGLIARWNILDEFDTYPNMLELLSIGSPINND